ncbi:MAG: uracil-DNA glycosylase [Flavobacteriaceae bacterium]|nr:uracil-DNA glycosylase [Flavobacteriaceae bacterium]
MTDNIHPQWKEILKNEFSQDYFLKIIQYLDSAYLEKIIYPNKDLIFKSFHDLPIDKIKVVILGQDPYYKPKMAHGLAFSVPMDEKIPRSLKNIFKEIENDIGNIQPENGNLERWAKQGVFLLNTALTVEENKPMSHYKIWEKFTNQVIQLISEKTQNVVFMLWGNFALQKLPLIDDQKHLILTASHPSPLSARKGFFGCQHFSQANSYLLLHHKTLVNW